MSDELILGLVALAFGYAERAWAAHKAKAAARAAQADAKNTREMLACTFDGVDALDGEKAEQAKAKIQERAKKAGVEPALNRAVKTRRLERLEERADVGNREADPGGDRS